MLGKNGGVSSHTWQLQEKILRFWRIVLLTRCAHVNTLQSTRPRLYRRFFQHLLNTQRILE